MKVYFHYTEGEAEEAHLTQKVTLPKSWAARHPVLKAHQLFLDAYNKKKGASFTAEETHLELEDGTVLYPDDPISRLPNRADLYLRPGKCPERPPEPETPELSENTPPPEDDGLVRCRNLGCKAWFREDDNPDDACRYHLGPAIFHDRGKGWACCKDKHRLVYSWEEFELIPGCQTGPHCKTPPANSAAIAASPTVEAAQRVQEREEQAPLKTAADFNRENPNAATTVSAATAAASKRPTCTRKEDGTAKCVRKGCQQVFRIRDNGPTACRYHAGEPVFWDTSKYWGCCPDQVKYDFDAFLAIPGCQTGYHDDASGDFDDDETAAATVAAFQGGVPGE
mmetsp:Transcript_4913/g.19647  ORF Transcript_4913/g.19647 Transcript_4913/m.19647 type:complete len:338 (-) Transcript_4913:25-1038(-)